MKYSVHVCQHNNWLGSPGVTCCKPPFPPIMQVFYQGNKDRLVNRPCRVDGGRRGRGLRKVRRRSYFYCPTSPLSLLFTVAHPLIQKFISLPSLRRCKNQRWQLSFSSSSTLLAIYPTILWQLCDMNFPTDKEFVVQSKSLCTKTHMF